MHFLAHSCRVYFDLLPLGTLAFLYAADILLAYRVLCIYRMNRALVITNCCIFVLCATTSIILAILTLSSLPLRPSSLYLTGCWSKDPSVGSFFVPLPGLLFEAWIFGLVLVKVITYSRKRGWKWVREGGVFGLLIRDSMGWFFVISIMIVLDIVLLATLDYQISSVGLSFFRSAVIIFGSGLIINMRKAARQAEDGEVVWQVQSAENTVAWQSYPETPTLMMQSEERRIGWALSIAQRVGLPPPLAQDFVTMWYQPVATLNHGTAARTIELDVVHEESSRGTDVDVQRPGILQFMPDESVVQSGRPSWSEDITSWKGQTSEQGEVIGIPRWRWDELEGQRRKD
ncbi:hypothetical protein FRB94_000126 [Tulasnella sp. JGI-2019a]|nr:hypothetical protein FRB94_000126 [Tulasnella sp. JGI-2019a]